jgi:putative ABC transport system permease protein
MDTPARPRPLRVIPSLAVANLSHEWILTLCLVVALAAVIAPLLVLLGLKQGTIETLRERLVEDPAFRELRPAQTREYPPEWFAEAADWPGVGFLTPTILPLSSVMQVPHPQRGGNDLYDLVPTAPGDPLLLENGATIPGEGEVVLTAEAGRRLGVSRGDEITGRVTRSRAGRTETAEALLKVVAVLPPRAGSLARIYAPLSFVLDVEAFKEGYGAQARGWSGDSPEPFLSFDGLVLLLPEPLPPIERTGLIVSTGFARISELDPDGVARRLGWTLPEGWQAYDLHIPGGTVTVSGIRAVEQKLRGRDRILLPYVLDVGLITGAAELRPVGISLAPEEAARIGLPYLPWGGFTGRAREPGRLTQALADAQGMPRWDVTAEGVMPLVFSLEIVGPSPLTQPLVPVELLGVLRTARQRAVDFDSASRVFVMQRGGYRGFRMYARSIDDVPELYARLVGEGIEVIAEVQAIERIRVLDAGLGRLFWLIAVLGFSGGVAVLVASLYASVERRRRDLGVLRLVGLARWHVFFFPVAQGVIIAMLGLLAALAAYLGLAATINRVFADDLAPGEKFCTLPLEYVMAAGALSLFLAVLSSLAAAWRATHVDPAEAIREQ